MRDFNPIDLVNLIQTGAADAHCRLRDLLLPFVARLVDRFQSPHLPPNHWHRRALPDRLLMRLHMWLRRDDIAAALVALSLDEFRYVVADFAARLLADAYLDEPCSATRNGADISRIPRRNWYDVRLHFQPRESVGGDDVLVSLTDDGALWVFVADFMGHDRLAFIVANGLANLWETSQASQLRADRNMAGLIDYLDDQIAQVSSNDVVFVAGTIARLDPSGHVVVGFAGSGPIFLDRPAAETRMVVGRGSMLGLGDFAQEGAWTTADYHLLPGDEFIMTSDGLIDAWNWLTPNPDDLLKTICVTPGKAYNDLTTYDMNPSPPPDDITMIGIRFLEPQSG
jgi:hypothetical protein